MKLTATRIHQFHQVNISLSYFIVVVLNSLRALASETSVLTNPEKLQSEIYEQLMVKYTDTEVELSAPVTELSIPVTELCSPVSDYGTASDVSPLMSHQASNYSQAIDEQMYSQQPDYSQELTFNFPFCS